MTSEDTNQRTEDIIDELILNKDENVKIPEHLKECSNLDLFLHSLFHMKLLYNKCIEVVDSNVNIINNLYDMNKTISNAANPDNIENMIPILEKLNECIKTVLENHSYTYISMSKVFIDYIKIKPKSIRTLNDDLDFIFKIGEKSKDL